MMMIHPWVLPICLVSMHTDRGKISRILSIHRQASLNTHCVLVMVLMDMVHPWILSRLPDLVMGQWVVHSVVSWINMLVILIHGLHMHVVLHISVIHHELISIVHMAMHRPKLWIYTVLHTLMHFLVRLTFFLVHQLLKGQLFWIISGSVSVYTEFLFFLHGFSLIKWVAIWPRLVNLLFKL